MVAYQGMDGPSETKVFDDFLSPDNDLTYGAGTVLVSNFAFVSVNEGSYEWTIDEPNGIVGVTTDTGDNDNAAFFAGRFQPSLGAVATEWRFKIANADCAVYCGFTETLALATPVMPAEFSSATMTYNGSGGMVGVNYDVDGTTDDFRSVFGDAGAASSGATSNGARAGWTVTADRWVIVRAEIDQDGRSRVYVGGDGVQGDSTEGLYLVEELADAVTASDQFYAVLMIENRSGNARVLEVDYGVAKGARDWNTD